MSKWQPIETAPKDQTQQERLLGFNPTYGVFVIKYDGWGGGTGGFDPDPWPDHDCYDAEEFKPTHWMPLPEFPK